MTYFPTSTGFCTTDETVRRELKGRQPWIFLSRHLVEPLARILAQSRGIPVIANRALVSLLSQEEVAEEMRGVHEGEASPGREKDVLEDMGSDEEMGLEDESQEYVDDEDLALPSRSTSPTKPSTTRHTNNLINSSTFPTPSPVNSSNRSRRESRATSSMDSKSASPSKPSKKRRTTKPRNKTDPSLSPQLPIPTRPKRAKAESIETEADTPISSPPLPTLTSQRTKREREKEEEEELEKRREEIRRRMGAGGGGPLGKRRLGR